MKKSIFYNDNNWLKNQKYFSLLKDFIEHQEKHLGNQVLMPKINEEIIILWHKNTNLMTVFNTKTLTVARKFKLIVDDDTYIRDENVITQNLISPNSELTDMKDDISDEDVPKKKK